VTTSASKSVEAVKIHGSGETAVTALDQVSVSFDSGAFTAIMGPSGSGKSTLLHCLAGLDRVSSGTIWIGETDLTSLSDADLTRLRRDRIGFVFQAFNLVPTLNAAENITLPSDIAGRSVDTDWLDELVGVLHIGQRLHHRPSELSGGEQQRVAVARALVGRPEVIFADEPTGNLDSKAGSDLLDFVRSAVRTYGQTVVMVTHDPVAAGYSDRTVFLADGNVVDELVEPTAASISDRMQALRG
jgi:putative ABC transport system ATP-binding protein